MKKLGIIAMAFAMLLGMSQCKKENTSASNDEVVKVPITLNVSGNSGSRVAVTPETGVVTFENGDVIHVVSNGVYVGTMTYNGTVFSGEITEPTEGQKLQFYFLGNKAPEFNADNTECSVVISDQTEYLPVISYAPSRENYQIGKTDYNATLLNKCALVKFDVTTASEAATCIVGMNNKVTVNLATNEFAYDMDGEGIITLAAGNGEKWGILLPQDEVNHTNAYSNDGFFIGSCATIPAIAENDYLTDGIALEINTLWGFVDGLFSVSDFQQVYFSKGNLQYRASTNTWRFAENQWNYVGGRNENNYQEYGNVYENSVKCSNNGISSTYSGWIDLFGWGTSGYNHGAICYQPWSTSTDANNYNAYNYYQYNLYDQTGQADWGYNAIINGGNQENLCRTLTLEEWDYVFNARITCSNIRWAFAQVNNVNGIILLPDTWTSSIYMLNNTNPDEEYGCSFSDNIINVIDWENVLEVNGAVFLPAAGGRNGTTLLYGVGDWGHYHSSSTGESRFNYRIDFTDGGFNAFGNGSRYDGLSVRLVRNAE